jgi:hypothetical protein
MLRLLSACVLLCALPCFGRTDGGATETVIPLQVRVAAAPKPALRYLLLPELREMNPGNPIQGYLICFMESNHFFFDKTSVEKREKWLTMPLEDLPAAGLRDYGRPALRQADYAARLDTVDWQTLLKLRRDGVYLLIPEVQQLRTLAAALKVRFRGEIADRRFDDALVTAKTMFAMARHLGEHLTFVGDLVGIAVASQALGPLEELIQQPGSPNLYWALSDLPVPFIDLRKAKQGERLWSEAELSSIDAREAMSQAQIQRLLARLQSLQLLKEDLAAWVTARADDPERVRVARARLVDWGLPADKVRQFPPAQVILLDEKLEFEMQFDDGLKVATLPYPEVEKIMAAAPPAKKDDRLLTQLVPATMKVRQSAARLDQRLALLRCVEALRLHAADHGGKLPAKLADVSVPLPCDPITGQPFAYQLDGVTASLRGTPPSGLAKVAAYNIRYVITIAP